jgi:excisionase family DNA binding protein
MTHPGPSRPAGPPPPPVPLPRPLPQPSTPPTNSGTRPIDLSTAIEGGLGVSPGRAGAGSAPGRPFPRAAGPVPGSGPRASSGSEIPGGKVARGPGSMSLKHLAAEATPHGRLLTSAEVAALFRVEKRTVATWAKTRMLPAIKTPGGQYRFPEGAVLADLEDNTP